MLRPGALRRYSTNKDAQFLSDLLNRIESITAKAETNGRKPQKKTRPNERRKPNPRTPDQVAHDLAQKKRTERVAVKGHHMRASRFQKGKSEFVDAFDGMLEAVPKPATTKSAPRTRSEGTRPRPKGRGPPRAPASKTETKSSRLLFPVESKELTPSAYSPQINGDTFFHGKVASVVHSLTARVAAVAKETLLKSNYPYKLPKLIIDQVNPTITANRFILQKDWSLDVDAAQLALRMKEVVRGDRSGAELKVEGVDQHSALVAQLVNQNGSLGLAQKKTLFDAVTGQTPISQLTEGAPWRK